MIETKEKTVDKKTLNESIRLNNAFLNYDEIIQKHFKYKYAYLDEWLLKESKLLLEETNKIENLIEPKFRVFKRGTIIKVDFGVGLGSEMSQVHFAIVINNYDSPKNNTLTVIPLTSKNNNNLNLDLGPIIVEKLINRISSEINSIELSSELSPDELIKLSKLNTLSKYYKSNVKNTFACCSLITTISKARILKPINEYDIIGRARCSSDVMDLIDNKLKELFFKQLDIKC